MNSDAPQGQLTLFCLYDMSQIGAQRMIASLVNAWPAPGRVAVALFSKTGGVLADVSPDVPIYALEDEAPLAFRARARVRLPGLALRALAYRRLIRRLKPQTVVGVNQMENLALCLVKRTLPDFHLVVSEHCHVTSNLKGADAHAGFFGWYYRRFFRHEYRHWADTVLSVSHEAAEDLASNHGIPREKIAVVYVPLPIERVRQRATEALAETDTAVRAWLADGNRTVVAVSRLEPQKRIDILVRAWAAVRRAPENDSANPFRLLICGAGSQREALERLVRELGLEDSVRFLGFLDNQFKIEKRAAVFASTSEWEGMPQTLIEAQALGVPIVSSDCPSGPRELLLDGRAGYLFATGDVNACAARLIEALTDPDGRSAKARVATQNLDRFDVKAIAGQYAALGRPRPSRA